MFNPTDKPEKFPEFELKTQDGKVITLNDLAGKPTFIRFSTTTCSICKAENPDIKSVEADESVKANFIDVNIGESSDTVNAYSKEQGLMHNILLDKNTDLTNELGILGTPTHFVLRPDGSVCFKAAGRLVAEQIKEIIANCK